MIHFLIRYLGIKTKLIDGIVSKVEEITPSGSKVLDMFAGSNIVGQSIKNNYIVYSNDIQQYSYITAKSVIEYIDPENIKRLDSDVIFNSEHYKKNKVALSKVFEKPLNYEKTLLSKIHNYNDEIFDDFIKLYNQAPYYTNYQNKHYSFDNSLEFFTDDFINKYKENNRNFPYILFSSYFGNPYFSLEQCIEIDSIRYAIDKLNDEELISQSEKDIYLSTLVYVLHNIVCSVGDHFAQPQIIQIITSDQEEDRAKINLRERKKIITKKRHKVQSFFYEKINEVKLLHTNGSKENKAFNLDFNDLLSGKYDNYISDIKTVYIDPPYTNAHYSRFYHIPETLIKYDYPDIEFKGRYRTDRYQSNFGVKSMAYDEFNNMIEKCAGYRFKLVISYSDTSQCILEVNEIIEICNKHYNNVEVNKLDHMYRNFGQKPNRVLAKEYIIVCQ